MGAPVGWVVRIPPGLWCYWRAGGTVPAVNTTPLVIVGAGGFGREVLDVVEAINEHYSTTGFAPWDVLGFVDDGSPDQELIDDRGVPFLGPVEKLAAMPPETQYVIGIGSGPVRRRIDESASESGRTAATLVHPTTVIGRHRITIGAGSVICANVAITTNVALGRHVHLNLGVTVGHDAVLGDYVTANPNVSISGGVTLEDEVNMGTGSIVIPGRRIGARTIIGAGATVVGDLPCDVTAVGVPARPRG
jgi:sugar O-acyltransferase (sialic acid O-acetyltransferase NeuD family)